MEKVVGFDEYASIQRYYIVGEKVPHFELLRDLMYRDEAGDCHVTKKGMISDLGSTPKWTWRFIPPHEFPSAYILHNEDCNNPKVPRKVGDDRLFESLKYCNARKWKRVVVYFGVRGYAIAMGLK